MTNKKFFGIRTKIFILPFVPIFIVCLLLGTYYSISQYRTLENNLQRTGMTLIRQLSLTSQIGLQTNNTKLLRQITRTSLADPTVKAVSIFDGQGKTVAYDGPNILRFGHLDPSLKKVNKVTTIDVDNEVRFIAPIVKSNSSEAKAIGWISIVIGHASTTLREYRYFLFAVIIFLGGLLLSAILAFRLGREITSPLMALTRAVRRIKGGIYATQVATGAQAELRQLEDGINSMAKSLQHNRDELQSNIDQATADLRETLETLEIKNVELDLLRQDAQEANRIKTEFIANMSHELRTPMNGILGFSKLLSDSPLNSNQKEYLSTIQNSAKNLLAIINDILDLSSLEAGKLTLDRMPIDLRDCIDEALAILAPSAQQKQLELIPMIYSDVPEKIIGDAKRIKQIITNLVGNAIKFTPEGHIIIRVMIDDESDDQVQLRVQITDTGIGIPKEVQKQLFLPFKQANSDIAREFGGTGLGLAICKKLVSQMQGKIGLESEENKGTTFWFTLNSQHIPINDSDAHNAKAMHDKQVLLFDDNDITRLSIKHQLNHWGMTVTSANSNSEIAERLNNHINEQTHFDLCILGTTEAKQLSQFMQQHQALFHHSLCCPILALVNDSTSTYQAELKQHGATISLAKPATRFSLLQAVKNLVKHQANLSKPAPQDTNTKENIRILAVDDTPANLKLLQILLERFGCDVTTITSGKAAIQAMLDSTFDLVFLDIQMPEMDGLETAQKIRQHQIKAPLIALTAYNVEDQRDAVLAAGMNDCLSKPIDEELLEKTIKQWVCKSIEVTPQQRTIDWELGQKLAGGKQELAEEMLTMLIASLPEELADINAAHEANDLLKLREHLHKLHGAVAYCGTPALKQAIERCSVAAKSESAHKVTEAVKTLNQACQDILSYKHSIH